MMRPKILISVHAPGMGEAYARAVADAGGDPVCEYCPRELGDAAALLLAGGGDLDPGFFREKSCGSRPPDLARDRAELGLCLRFLSLGRPVLGICRGLQVLNVALGGSVIQDLPGHGQAEGRDRLHAVRTAEGCPLAGLFGPGGMVNSAHHQALGRLGRGLAPWQWAADGVIEAAGREDLPAWGLQWHPERLRGPGRPAGTADGDALFRRFLEQIKERS